MNAPPVFDKEIIAALSREPDVEELLKREGGGGSYLTYLADYTVIDKLNQIFGYGWNFRLLQPVTHIELFDGALFFKAEGELTVLASDGTPIIHADIGTGITRSRRGSDDPYLSDSVDMAIKGAVSDCIKRCARQLGAAFGNTLYDKDNPLHDESDKYLRAEGMHPAQRRSGGGGGRSPAGGSSNTPDPNGPNGTYICEECGEELFNGGKYTAAQRAGFSMKDHGRILCYKHSKAAGK